MITLIQFVRASGWMEYVLWHDEILCNLMEGRMVGKPTRGRRRLQMLDDLYENNSYSYEVMKRTATYCVLRLTQPSSLSGTGHEYLWTLWCYESVFFLIILTSLYLVEGLAWWDWPFTWWTDQLLSFSALTLLTGPSDP